MNILSLDNSLVMLIKKYGPVDCPKWKIAQRIDNFAEDAEYVLVPGAVLAGIETPAKNIIPLLHWRKSRRFIEMRNIVAAETIEDVSMVRVRNFSLRGTSMSKVLYREFDLLQWITGHTIESIFASTRDDGLAVNLAIRLDSGVCCGMELCVALTGLQKPIDRHELIARRGVVCDQVIDSIIRPSSVYVFGQDMQTYTDTDAELFGLNDKEITLVRAAHDALMEPETFTALRKSHSQLVGLVKTAFDSADQCRRLDVKGVTA